MTSRERLVKALNHEEADKIPVDLGAMMSTGIMGIAYNELKKYLGITGGRTRMYDLYQQLGEPEREVLEIVGADVLPTFVNYAQEWKKSTLPDGSECEVPVDFNPETLEDGSKVIRNDEGIITARMPADGYYFDGTYHQLADVTTVEELNNREITFKMPTSEQLETLHNTVKHLYENTDYGIFFNGAGGIYEWSQGLRDWPNFMMDLAGDPDFACALMDRLVELNIKRLEKILPVIEGYVQVVQVGDDLGTQNAPQISPETFRKLIKPRLKELYGYIKSHTSAKLFLHSCGAIRPFLGDLVEIGLDIINPVQVAAANMDTKELKKEFGNDLVFWGGGCDTQHVLPFGTPEEVDREVKKRIDDLAPGGGFVFCQVHNIQAGVPPANIMAMYDAVKKYGKY